MSDGILETGPLEGRNDRTEGLGVHPHRIGLSVRLIQVRLVEDVPVAPLFGKDESSCLVGRNPCHRRGRFVSGRHIELGICLAEDIGFIE